MAKVRKRMWQSGGVKREAWVADYFDQHSKRHIKTFERKKDASDFLDEVKGELRRGTHTPACGSKTVKEAADLWIDHCENGTADYEPLERSTVREYRRHVDQYINDGKIGIGAKKLAELTYADITVFEARLKEGGKSTALIRKIRSSLSALLSDAMEHSLVGKHVIRDTQRNRKRRRKDRQEKIIAMPSKDELRTPVANGN